MTQQPDRNSSRMSYNAFADKIGLVPNIRFKDNLFQGLVVAAFTLAGATVGFFAAGNLDAIGMGALSGLITGGLLSGFVLMVVGLRRKG
jgi:hypothetical protein